MARDMTFAGHELTGANHNTLGQLTNHSTLCFSEREAKQSI